MFDRVVISLVKSACLLALPALTRERGTSAWFPGGAVAADTHERVRICVCDSGRNGDAESRVRRHDRAAGLWARSVLGDRRIRPLRGAAGAGLGPATRGRSDVGCGRGADRPRAAQVGALPGRLRRVRLGFRCAGTAGTTSSLWPSRVRLPPRARTRARPRCARIHRRPTLRLYGGAAEPPKPATSAAPAMGEAPPAGVQGVYVTCICLARPGRAVAP